MFKKFFIMLGTTFACAALSAQIVADSSLKVPESWTPKTIMGRDFWMMQMLALRGEKLVPDAWSCLSRPDVYFSLEKASPGIQEIAKEPAFHDVAVSYECRPDGIRRNQDDSFSILLPDIPASSKEAMERPFFITGFAARATGVNPYAKGTQYYHKTEERAKDAYRRFFFGKYKSDPDEFAAWKKKYPNFVAFYGCGEWMGDASQWLFEGTLRTAAEYDRFITPEEDDWNTFRIDAFSGKLKFPHIEALLKMICSEVNPVKVEGDVQFGLNKTESGWWLYLFNNKGVMKLDGKEEWFDMNRVAEVKIDFDKVKVRDAKELRSGETLAVKNNKLTLKIDPGDFKILELK